MNNKEMSAGTADKQSTTDEANNVTPQLQQCNVSGSLPDFLYEDDGEIKVGVHGDSVVTDSWINWLSNNDR